MARCTLVRDKVSGTVCGLWLRDPGLARKRERLVMLAVAESLPMDVYAKIVEGDYRVVPNTFDAAGGCFVMFGSARAPGEERAQPPPEKKGWQFWKADVPSDLPGKGQDPVNPFSTDAVIQGGELRFKCPSCPGAVAVDLDQMDPITGLNAVCPNCRNVSHVPGGYRAGQQPAGLDERFGWSPHLVPAIHLAGLALFGLGQGLFSWAMASNRYFSTAVRIQMDRGHTVATGGPYRYVRHPGYTGYAVSSFGMSLALGSLWAMIPTGLVACLLVVRTALEDQTLQDELSGYRDYAQRVRYRLLPGIW